VIIYAFVLHVLIVLCKMVCHMPLFLLTKPHITNC